MPITKERPVLIIGAGVAGLTLAQGLHYHGIPFHVYERYPKSRTAQGHRFRCSFEVVDKLKTILSPAILQLFEKTIPKETSPLPLYTESHEYNLRVPPNADPPPPGIAFDRSWIRTLLSEGIEDKIEYEMDLISYHILNDGFVKVLFSDGHEAQGSILVGADGLRSKVRKQLQPQRKFLDLEMWSLWTRIPLMKEIRSKLSAGLPPWCLAHDKAANRFIVQGPQEWSNNARDAWGSRHPPLEDYTVLALSTPVPAIIPKTPSERKEFVTDITKDWHPTLTAPFKYAAWDLAGSSRIISSKPDLELDTAPHREKILLLGDAAHAMSPMGGSGGTTAILNAVDLAETLAKGEEGIGGWISRMSERAKERIEFSFGQGKIFMEGREWWEYGEVEL